jgi:hypothetical protein
MRDDAELGRILTTWLRQGASSAGSERVLGMALGRVAETPQDRRRLWPPVEARHRPRAVRMAIIVVLALIAVLAVVLVGSQRNTPEPIREPFSAGPALSEFRAEHTATVLQDGGVLVVGGYGRDAFSSAELLEPGGTSFRAAGSLRAARFGHTATLLPDGRVLIVGGEGGSVLDTAELWDPATEAFVPTGQLATARRGHTASLLPDGRVLIVGGQGASPVPAPVAAAEIWDPTTGRFASAGSTATPLTAHTAIGLEDGRVLIVGGDAAPCVAPGGQLWDPVTQSFSPMVELGVPRLHATATATLDGQVLVIGGLDPKASQPNQSPVMVDDAVLWDPTSGLASPAGRLNASRWYHTATLLRDGRVLAVGGASSGPTAEVWDPSTRSFAAAGSLPYSRYPHTAAILPDGHVLLSGSWDQVWDPAVSLPVPLPSEAMQPPGATQTPPPRPVAGGSVPPPDVCEP